MGIFEKQVSRRDGSYGKAFWEELRTKKVPKGQPHAGEWAIDHYSRKIVQDEAGFIAVNSDLAKVQFQITKFWQTLIAHSGAWHYDQGRPGDPTVDPAREAITIARWL